MKQIFQADDGKLFETQAECERYENTKPNNRLIRFIEGNISTRYDQDAGFDVISVNDVAEFIKNHINEISEILSRNKSNTPFGGWFINTETTNGHPPELKSDDFIEVMYTSGYTESNTARRWSEFWNTTTPTHIVKYRKVY